MAEGNAHFICRIISIFIPPLHIARALAHTRTCATVNEKKSTNRNAPRTRVHMYAEILAHAQTSCKNVHNSYNTFHSNVHMNGQMHTQTHTHTHDCNVEESQLHGSVSRWVLFCNGVQPHDIGNEKLKSISLEPAK
jgi:hypothetical protein